MLRLSLLLCAVAFLSAASARRRPFRSIKAPEESVNDYSVTVPQVLYKEDGDGPYPKALHVSVVTEELNVTLQLELNDVLIPPKFTSRYYGNNGEEIVTKGHTNCYYQGKVKEHPDWIAIMSACHGLQGSFGLHSFGQQVQSDLYHIEPLSRDNRELSQPHAVYPDSEYEIQGGTCGTHHPHHDPYIHFNNTMASLNFDLPKKREERQSSQQFLFVELVMVNDRSQYLFYSSNLEATVNRALDIANHVDTLFRVLGVRIALVDVITWTQGDQINIVSDPEALLNNFRGYVPQVTTSHDSLMLITHIDLTGSTIGIAFTGTMCSSTASVGLTQDTGRNVGAVGSTAAHELGHVMSMDHDDAASCNCPDGDSQCIMAATLSFSPPTQWSQCSINDLNDGFNNGNLDRCLFNQPTGVVGDPTCGNGIQEDGEACDCGSPSECTNPCCDASTCQLVSGAQCSSGSCCDLSTCQFRQYGTTCRASSGQCDITEFCLGDSQDCPVDTYIRDGTSCNGNQDYCYEGACQTLDSQCQRHFKSNEGDSRCYSTYNTRGDQFGNCGYTASSFIACATSDVNCGMLFCEVGTYQQTASVGVTIVTVGVGGGVQCHGFTPPPGTDVPNPGLVADGTRCGSGRACYQQSCISVSSLPTVSGLPACPTRDGQQCSNNGQCNQLGGCTCEVGYTGGDCSTPTGGPGVGPVNECMDDNGGCDQICTDTQNSFTCSCNTGYTLDSNGRSCNDINECTANTDGCSQICTNTVGGFKCSCKNGYTIAPDGIGCNDLNECATDNGGCDQTCNNNQGSFTCSCNTGYLLAGDGRSCADLNECNVDNGLCTQICENIQSSYRCRCESGFQLEGDGKTCTAINACGNNNCEQFCSNQGGSFICSCRPGYKLGGDEKSCDDINECEGDHGCSDICVNTDGSFECKCPSGFQLDGEQRSCTETNECAVGSHDCSDICTNTVGSFECSCPPGYELDSNQRTCSEVRNGISSPSTGSGGSSGGSSMGAIAGGVVVAIVAITALVIIVILILILVYRRKSKPVSQTTKYTRGKAESRAYPNTSIVASSGSMENLLDTDGSTIQFQGPDFESPLPAYQPPAPLYPSVQGTDQTRHPPFQPSVNRTPAQPTQPPVRRVAPPPPQAQPPPKPSAPLRPNPPAFTHPKPPAPTAKPLLPTKPVGTPPAPPVANTYVPPPTFKLPPPPVLQPQSPPAHKPTPALRPPVSTKPTPAPKQSPSAPSKVNIQWPPPSPGTAPALNGSAAPTPGRKPMLPPAKKPMVPPKK